MKKLYKNLAVLLCGLAIVTIASAKNEPTQSKKTQGSISCYDLSCTFLCVDNGTHGPYNMDDYDRNQKVYEAVVCGIWSGI